MNQFVKVKSERISRGRYMWIIICNILSLRFFVNLARLTAYYIVNFSDSRQRARIGKSSNVHPTVILRQAQRITIGEHCLINHNNVFQAGHKVATITIGDYVHTGPNVMMFAYNHSIDSVEMPSKEQDYYDASIVIENDVWIGAGSVILAGVTIGKGSVIAAGSVVNRDVPQYSIAAGAPARVVKSRI